MVAQCHWITEIVINIGDLSFEMANQLQYLQSFYFFKPRGTWNKQQNEFIVQKYVWMPMYAYFKDMQCNSLEFS